MFLFCFWCRVCGLERALVDTLSCVYYTFSNQKGVSRGEFGVFLESRGDKYPYRLKFRSTGLPLVSIMETVCRGAKIADLIALKTTRA